MFSLLCLSALVMRPAEAPRPAKLDRDTLIRTARPVLAAIVAAGRANQKRATPLKDDELTQYYVRTAATAAGRLPEKQAGPAFLLAIGVALDTSAMLRNNPVTGSTWKRIESDAERNERLKVLGTPTVHGRHDLAQHFSVSAALTASSGARAAEAAGIVKELLDAEEGGSGFSFADLAADLSGLVFAERILASPERLARVAKNFTVADFAVPPKGLTEGLTREQFNKRYGGIRDERFRKELETLRKRVKALPGNR